MAPYVLGPVVTRAIEGATGPANRDGWVEIIIPTESTRHAHRDLLRLGAEVEVLEPPELRVMMTATAPAVMYRQR